jgi:hypothetical protein
MAEQCGIGPAARQDRSPEPRAWVRRVCPTKYTPRQYGCSRPRRTRSCTPLRPMPSARSCSVEIIPSCRVASSATRTSTGVCTSALPDMTFCTHPAQDEGSRAKTRGDTHKRRSLGTEPSHRRPRPAP